jgi:hypothetical protein
MVFSILFLLHWKLFVVVKSYSWIVVLVVVAILYFWHYNFANYHSYVWWTISNTTSWHYDHNSKGPMFITLGSSSFKMFLISNLLQCCRKSKLLLHWNYL